MTRRRIAGFTAALVTGALIAPASALALDSSTEFTPASGSPLGTDFGAWATATGDWNGDGIDDVASAEWFDADNGGAVRAWLSDGEGGFAQSDLELVGVSPSGMVSGDWNDDGDPDLATANVNSDNVSILMGDGTGDFDWRRTSSASRARSRSTSPTSTNNGAEDLLLGGRASGRVPHPLRQRDGFEEEASVTLPGTTPRRWPLPPATSTTTARTTSRRPTARTSMLRVYLANSRPARPSPCRARSRSADAASPAADFDNDGDDDLALANFGFGPRQDPAQRRRWNVSLGSTPAAGDARARDRDRRLQPRRRRGPCRRQLVSNNVSILTRGTGATFGAAANSPEAIGANPRGPVDRRLRRRLEGRSRRRRRPLAGRTAASRSCSAATRSARARDQLRARTARPTFSGQLRFNGGRRRDVSPALDRRRHHSGLRRLLGSECPPARDGPSRRLLHLPRPGVGRRRQHRRRPVRSASTRPCRRFDRHRRDQRDQ